MENVDNKLADIESKLVKKLNPIGNELTQRVEALKGRASHRLTDNIKRYAEGSRHNSILPANARTPSTHHTIVVFDGKTPWEDYMTIVETEASIHG